MISGKNELIIEVNKFNEDWVDRDCLIEDFEILITGNKVVCSKSEKIQ